MSLEGFGRRLTEIRKDRGLTQKQLANLLGVTEQAVSKWERGTSYPDVAMLNEVARILDCSLDHLFQLETGRNNLSDQESAEHRSEINSLLLPDIISLTFGTDLTPLFSEENSHGWPHVLSLRKQIASQWGILVPTIHLMDQITLRPNQYQIRLNGVPVFTGTENIPAETKNSLIRILGNLKTQIFQHIDQILNNQLVCQMVENLRAQYPHTVEGIVPELISYSYLRQVLIRLLKYGYTANPLALIIESMESHMDITEPLAMAKQVAADIGPGFSFGKWVDYAPAFSSTLPPICSCAFTKP